MSAQEILSKLPEDVQQQVLEYIEFLVKKYGVEKQEEPLDFSWAGALRDLKDEYTSVELQHEASRLR